VQYNNSNGVLKHIDYSFDTRQKVYNKCKTLNFYRIEMYNVSSKESNRVGILSPKECLFLDLFPIGPHNIPMKGASNFLGCER